MNKKIPESVLAPLSKYAWRHGEFELDFFQWGLRQHQKSDDEWGVTCTYAIDGLDHMGMVDSNDVRAMIKQGEIPETFTNAIGINQHYLHSLVQFYAAVSLEYEKHLKRTNSLIGTSAGTIRRSHMEET